MAQGETRMKDWKLGTRLSAGYGVLLGIAVVLAGYAAWRSASVNRDVQRLTEERVAMVELLTRMKENASTIATSVRNIALLTEVGPLLKEKGLIDAARADNNEAVKRLEVLLEGHPEADLARRIAESRAVYRVSVDKALSQAMEGDAQGATDHLLDEARPLQAAYFAVLDKAIVEQRDAMHASTAAIQARTRTDAVLLGVLALIAAAVGGAFIWDVRRHVVAPLRQAVSVARTVAAGDLSVRIEVRRDDETGELLRALHDMAGGLAALVGEVRDSSDHIATGSSEIASGSADLSRRTETQAASLQQTAASMSQLDEAVRRNAETARDARSLALNGVDVAVRGGEAVSQVVATMDTIAGASRKVADIITVIDGLAFQSNILALNAAVEAARAGEQGRGFAVVAGEVHQLAQRSAAAAREIRGLIQANVEQVEAGHQQVGEAGRTMQALVVLVRRVGSLVVALSERAAEQTAGLGQIGHAVQQLDHVTQQNAALVEQSTAAAESLRDQAGRLAEVVGRFRLA